MENQSNEMSKAMRRPCNLMHKMMTVFATIVAVAMATLAGGCNSADKADKSADATDEASSETTTAKAKADAAADRSEGLTASLSDIGAELSPASAEANEASSVAPLTQYALVEVLDGNMGVGFRSKAGEVLKSLGFTVKQFERPADVDEMAPFVFMTAHRQEPSGSTNIAFMNGEDQLLTIDFASREDVDKFVESMKKSGYKYYDGIYAHPQNKNGMGQIYVKVRGQKVKIISPFEMLPSKW